MESPIAQNRHHVQLLNRAFDDGLIPKYRRLGALPMRPAFRSLVVISKEARMKWPRKRLPEMDQVIKVEDIDKYILDAIDAASSLKILSLVTPGAIRKMGEHLARLHDPKPIDWFAKLRLDPQEQRYSTRSGARQPEPASAASPTPLQARPSKPSPIATDRRCALCSGPITMAEVYYSTVKLHAIFGGKAVCRSCQESTGTAGSGERVPSPQRSP